MNILTGVLQEMAPTFHSFGEQYSKIGGVRYVTYENMTDPKLKGLCIGANIESKVSPGPTVLCNKPHVESPLPSARFLRVLESLV